MIKVLMGCGVVVPWQNWNGIQGKSIFPERRTMPGSGGSTTKTESSAMPGQTNANFEQIA